MAPRTRAYNSRIPTRKKAIHVILFSHLTGHHTPKSHVIDLALSHNFVTNKQIQTIEPWSPNFFRSGQDEIA
jgi:hypothetical protein